jgi:hypothetical protein
MRLGKTPVFKMLFIGLVVSAVWFAATEHCYSAGDFDVAIDVSRTEGVAPLSVFFDATGTPDLSDGTHVDTTLAGNFDADNLDPAANRPRHTLIQSRPSMQPVIWDSRQIKPR